MPASSSGKVRIIGGKWKRSPVLVLDASGLRPTGNRQRETLFNWLSHILESFENRKALDMFGGSGALSFEFLSRGGAASVLFDINRAACAQIRQTAQKLGAENFDIRCADSLAPKALGSEKFDLIFIDAPFALHLQEKALASAAQHLTADGVIYVESPKELTDETLKRYGLTPLRRQKSGASCMLLAAAKEA